MSRILGQGSLLSRLHFAPASRAWLATRALSAAAAAAKATSTSSAEPTTLAQLERVTELQKRVGAENSKLKKAIIIAEYPDLRHLLEYIYQPHLKLHLTGKTLDRFIDTAGPVAGGESPDTIIELFELLESRTLTGNHAKNVCYTFLVRKGIMNSEGTVRPELLETFYRLLDRNLTAGFGANTLKEITWSAAAPSARPTKTRGAAKPKASKPAKPAKAATPDRVVNLEKFSCALGKSINPPFSELFDGKDARWFTSRKLDGIRCLTFVDIRIQPDSKPQILDITFKSRAGNTFTSLRRLDDQLRALEDWPGLKDILDRDPTVLSETAEYQVKRLVLDGEVCVMRPMTPEELSVRAEHDDGSVEADALWTNDGLTEDFQATVSQVKRQSADVQHPAYFVFDVVSWAEFAVKGPVAAPELGKSFGQRIKDVEEIGSFLARQEHPLVRALAQREVRTRSDFDGMVHRAASEGWEGLVFRADKPYNGKRSRDIYKFKKWQDDEYVVVSAHNSTMRLAVDGVYEEREACANVIIEHNGHPVSVGSGFSAEQRLRYARDPSEIVGKHITVEYFAESEALDRPGVMSLRFPRVKQVWEEGTRNV